MSQVNEAHDILLAHLAELEKVGLNGSNATNSSGTWKGIYSNAFIDAFRTFFGSSASPIQRPSSSLPPSGNVRTVESTVTDRSSDMQSRSAGVRQSDLPIPSYKLAMHSKRNSRIARPRTGAVERTSKALLRSPIDTRAYQSSRNLTYSRIASPRVDRRRARQKLSPPFFIMRSRRSNKTVWFARPLFEVIEDDASDSSTSDSLASYSSSASGPSSSEDENVDVDDLCWGYGYDLEDNGGRMAIDMLDGRVISEDAHDRECSCVPLTGREARAQQQRGHRSRGALHR
ncbi:uncharacterized protein LTR77_006433 [Saxophila tyrrhenica]|uniref:Uncharacterized protein n=1 Tax=Saxophila tyrrhenica TaxID=1690608 RepID=A0AAV9P7W0_9PEZI|nr:hypothetical protein LTR77_006433 [Saxophila tyrrhenica]